MMNSGNDPQPLIDDLRASRAHLDRITAHLTGERLLGPQLSIVNPPLWELGHIAWFQEFWCLRRRPDGTAADALMRSSDGLYDSARVAHGLRWTLPLPDLAATRSFQAEVLGRVIERLEREPDNEALRYFARLACYHEDMHAEAFRYTCQTLGYPDLMAGGSTPQAQPAHSGADIELPGGRLPLGASRRSPFVFDNEKWEHEVFVAPFKIARTAVTNAQFLQFVESGSYAQREYWSDDGWRWVAETDASAPRYWIRRGGEWLQRRFDSLEPLRPDEPIIHVSWHEAQAFCTYANRRLPSEAEWECAAAWDESGTKTRRYPWGSEFPSWNRANLESSGVASVGAYAAGDSGRGVRQLIGNTWEWTASTFARYPGFTIDPYAEYSEPWFGTHKVLRGGSFATTRRLVRNTFRNFYLPERNDVFAGFRTCAR